MVLRHLFIILMSLTLISCSMTKTFELTPEEEYSNAYSGTDVSKILETYGKPTNVSSDGNDGMILTYEERRDEFMSLDNESESESMMSESSNESSYTSNEDTGTSDESEINLTSTNLYKHFYIDKDNKCYKVETNDYLKGGNYRKYFNKVTITEMSLIAILGIVVNIVF